MSVRLMSAAKITQTHVTIKSHICILVNGNFGASAVIFKKKNFSLLRLSLPAS